MNSAETIAAVSSAVGAAARMVVRLSGSAAHRIAGELIVGNFNPAGGSALFGRVWPGVCAWIYWFASPRSYSGDDLIEFHIPGSPVAARMLLDEIIRRGARPAEPGEFTARAYFSGRIDLTQAEGVAATIAAQSERELQAARQLLGGELARRLAPLMDDIAQALALVEVGIDFSDEDVTFLSGEQVRQRCLAAAAALAALLDDSTRFERLSHEPRVVLIGRPNAGKSTLLNALAGRERAVVSNVAGTTRDAIWAQVKLLRGMIKLVDVAGIEESTTDVAPDSAQASIAHQMHEQALREVATADLVILVQEWSNSVELETLPLPRAPDLVVRTKADIVQTNEESSLVVSALTGAGLEDLRSALDRLAFGSEPLGNGLALNARHVRALAEARDALARAAESTAAGAEVAALELREALDALASVLGRISPDDLLGRIFSQFCMGK